MHTAVRLPSPSNGGPTISSLPVVERLLVLQFEQLPQAPAPTDITVQYWQCEAARRTCALVHAITAFAMQSALLQPVLG